MARSKRGKVGEVHYTTRGRVPTVELAVPAGTSLAEMAEAIRFVSTEINPSISPVGCEACLSGTHFMVRELYENVVRVDLSTGKMVDRMGP